MKIFKCQTCGLDKTLQSKKKDGTTFMSCPNWKDQEHTRAREEWKRRTNGAPEGTYNASGSPTTQPKPQDGFQILADEFINLRLKVEELIKLIKEQTNL